MTRLFGCTCNQPERLAEALEPVRSRFVAAAPVPRWGLGYVQGGEVLLSRKPRHSEHDVDLYEPLRALKSDYIIGWAAEDDGLAGNVNTQPFRFRRWVYAQLGRIGNFERVGPLLAEHVPDFLRRNIHGKTAGEQVFHVFLSLLYDAGKLDDPKLPTAESRVLLRDALALVWSLLTEAGDGAGDTELGNLVVSNGRSMLAARLRQPLFMRRLTVSNGDGRDSTFRGVLALSTEDDPGEGFEEIPARSVLAVDRDVRVDIIGLDD